MGGSPLCENLGEPPARQGEQKVGGPAEGMSSGCPRCRRKGHPVGGKEGSELKSEAGKGSAPPGARGTGKGATEPRPVPSHRRMRPGPVPAGPSEATSLDPPVTVAGGCGKGRFHRGCADLRIQCTILNSKS